MYTARTQPIASRTAQMPLRDLIARLSQFHHRLAGLYARRRITARSEDARMYLDMLAGHERAVGLKLQAYCDSAPREAIDTWIKYTPDVSVDHVLDSCTLAPDPTRGEVAALDSELSRVSMDAYGAIVEGTAAETVREVIRNLYAFEHRSNIYKQRSVETR
jgi:hypothetical protein